jgi:hypothetical protein
LVAAASPSNVARRVNRGRKKIRQSAFSDHSLRIKTAKRAHRHTSEHCERARLTPLYYPSSRAGGPTARSPNEPARSLDSRLRSRHLSICSQTRCIHRGLPFLQSRRGRRWTGDARWSYSKRSSGNIRMELVRFARSRRSWVCTGGWCDNCRRVRFHRSEQTGGAEQSPAYRPAHSPEQSLFESGLPIRLAEKRAGNPDR